MSDPAVFPVIPPQEERCVWMKAGIVPYQLCNQKCDCDVCDIDAAIRLFFPYGKTARVPFKTTSRIHALPTQNYRFSRNHWWATRTAEGILRMGIEAGLIQALPTIKGIVLPSARVQLTPGQVGMWLVLDGATLPLEVPVGGTVLEVNQQVIAEPWLLSLDPFENGWVLEMETGNRPADEVALLPVEQAQSRYAADREHFRSALSSLERAGIPQYLDLLRRHYLRLTGSDHDKLL
jgi:glycine cleavage system H protein